MLNPLFPKPHRKSSSQKRPRPTFSISGSKPTFHPRKQLSISDTPIVSSSVTDEGFTTAWSLFMKKLIANHHHDIATATTPQEKLTISKCFDADVCTLLDVYETRIQDASWQPLGGRVFMDLAYRRFAKTVASTYPWRTLDVERNAELRKGDDALSVFWRRYLLAEELDQYMAGPRGFLRRAIADRDGESVGLRRGGVEMGKSGLNQRAKDILESREEIRVLEWVRSISSTEDKYWDILNRQKIARKRASGEKEENRKRLSEELEGTGYECASEVEVGEDIPNRPGRNDSVIRHQSAKEAGRFLEPDKEADGDEDEDYYTADEGDDADCTEEEIADDQKTNVRTNSDIEHGYDGATEEAYGTHSDEETLAGSEAPRRNSRKGSSSSSSDETEAKEEEGERRETAAGEGEPGSGMAGKNKVVAF